MLTRFRILFIVLAEKSIRTTGRVARCQIFALDAKFTTNFISPLLYRVSNVILGGT